MTPASPRFLSLALHLLAMETGADPGSEAVAGAAERVLQKLRGQLVRLIGPTGFQALLGRALTLVLASRPDLNGLTVTEDGEIAGLGRLAASHAEPVARDMAAMVVGAFVELLAVFIGEDLTLRQIRRIWPDASLDGEG
jgi:hypothetical protein